MYMMTVLYKGDDMSSIGNNNPMPVEVRGYSFKNIATNTTTAVKASAGFLHSIVVNTAAAGTITVYDNVGADTDNPIAILKASVAENTYLYDVEFTAGLKIVTGHADSDITVSYL